MSSSYPDALDVFTRLVNQYDKPLASWWNQLFAAIYNLEVALGVDPSVLGSGFGTYTDVASILGELAKVEVGEFNIEIPTNAPTRVFFASGESRFDIAGNMVVICNMKLNNAGRKVSPLARHSAVIVLGPISSDPYGFDFYRTDMDNASGTLEGRTETWSYIAIEENI